MTSVLTRCSISLDADLLQAFDELVKDEGYPTRSEGIKGLIRKALAERNWQSGGVVAGAVLMVYDHHKSDLVQQLMHIQHDHGEGLIISSQHIHLDHSNCFEMITVKGEAAAVRKLAEKLRSVKGVKELNVTITTTGSVDCERGENNHAHG